MKKNAIGCVVFLLLIVSLSQSRLLDFVFETYLGRTILVTFILFISYTNHILGIVTVFFIILLFNHSHLSLLEGMESKTNGKKLVDTAKIKMDTMVKSSKEGTNLKEVETNLLKGKSSNTIPVQKSTSNEGFEPYDSSAMKKLYSSFR